MKPALVPIALLVATALLSSGCDDSGPRTHEGAEQPSPPARTPADWLADLQLDDGSKWEVDVHTKTVFAKMAASFLGSDHSSMKADELKKAGADLDLLIRDLVQGCTMTGEAHDQLHVLLAAYMPTVSDLSENGRIEDAQLARLCLERYAEYFE